MRILTWNIHAARDADLATIAREIAALHPDVVCLNEVRRRQGKRLGRLLGLDAHVASSPFGPYGNAVFTNVPVASRRTLRFAGVRRRDRRDAAVLELAGGPVVVAVHLNALRANERSLNAAELLGSLPDRAIVAGDLNEGPDGPVAKLLSSRFQDACGASGEPTFPANAPRVRIDYVWLPRGTRANSCRVAPTDASDHRPVIVDVGGI